MAEKPDPKSEVREPSPGGASATSTPGTLSGSTDGGRPTTEEAKKLANKLASAEEANTRLRAAISEQRKDHDRVRSDLETQIKELRAEVFARSAEEERELERGKRHVRGVFQAKVTLVISSHDESARREIVAGEMFEADESDLAGLTEGTHFE